jgi:phospholipase C
MPGHTEIDTIVVVMFENRSFDHVLGHLSHPDFGKRTAVEGLGNPATTTRYDNVYDQQIYKPFPMQDGVFTHDPPHGRKTIATQLDVINQQATMRGFVKAYVQRTHSAVTEPPPMGFLVPGAVPVSGFLAAEYGVCNRWFSPLPTGTQPNRSMAFAGETLIDENAGLSIPNRGLVLDWLAQRGVRWRVYHSGLSFFVLFNSPHVLGPHFRSVRRLAQDFMDEPADEAPQVVFIEPEYDDSPVHFGFAPNDNHPPLPMGPGELFLHNIYAALTANPARWAKTLLVVTYDEHGGFYDHVEPMRIPYIPPTGARFGTAFETTGVRVPALVASPWVSRGSTIDAPLDHTSILQFLAEKFAGGPEQYSRQVTRRRQHGIQSLSAVLSDEARQDLPLPPANPIVTTSLMRPGSKQPQNENQAAFSVTARALLQADRPRALDRFPELALLQG